MRTSTLVRTTVRDLAYELIRALYHEWQAISRQAKAIRTAKKVSGYIAAVIGISLAVNVILSAPSRESNDRHPGHYVVNGLHIAVPNNFWGISIEQLVPLP